MLVIPCFPRGRVFAFTAMRDEKGPASRLEIFGWCMFDFANSSYTTLIVTVVYAIYFMGPVCEGAKLSRETGELLWGLGNWLSQGLVLITAPVVGAITDFSGAKKGFLLVTYLGCVLGTVCLGFVGPGQVALGLGLFILSNLFYSSGENIVAAFLPEIATPERMGRVSGLGWALGYFGGLASLAACYPLVAQGIDAEHSGSVRLSFVVVAAFFFVAALPTFIFLKERAVPQQLPQGKGYVSVGFTRVFETLGRVRQYRQLFRFLFVFLAYSCGIFVVVAYANQFGKEEIGMSMSDLMILFIALQLAASGGAFVFGILQDRVSSWIAIQLSLFVWLAVCVGAYFTETKSEFYGVGVLAGIAMGSSQSAARALVGSFSPIDRAGEFFGFWGLFWKLAGVGPVLFGLLRQWVDMRTAILSTGVFFLLGIVGMLFIDEKEGRKAAAQSPPSERIS